MPTTQTSNAIGTARQFTQQPPQTYQRQLILPRFGDNVRASETTQGAALARSLGVLSAAVEQYRVDYDKRQREIAIVLPCFNRQVLEICKITLMPLPW